uniref:Platelet glycoprotein 4 n=1 Tax=Mola mola TaxID=94237 RepID=A0A3Q3VJ78_MOLML
MGCCNRWCGLVAGAVFGAAVAILGGILIPVGNIIIEGTVEKEAVIEPGTTAYDNWVSTAATVYRQFWLFDLKNAQEVLDHGAMPKVVEKGPYTYRTRYLPKENITFDNHTASFTLPLGAIFEPSMSVGPEEDEVTTLNLFVAGAYSLIEKKDHIFLEIYIRASKSSLFQRRTIKEMLWGYKEPLLAGLTGLFANYTEQKDGPYTIFTGKDDISKVGMIDSWRGEKNLTFWNDTYCNMINGTDASSFPPFVDKKKPLYFFSSDICRSVSASFSQKRDLKGIEVYRYTLEQNTLAAPTVNPDNQCYCRDPLASKNCSVAGALDISSCQDSQKTYLHLSAPLPLREEILMLFLFFYQITGFTLGFAKRIQVNMMYGPSNVVTVLKKVKDYTIFPLVWLNETAVLDEETANMFKKELLSRINMLETIQWTLLSVGVGIFVLCLAGFCMARRSHTQSETI